MKPACLLCRQGLHLLRHGATNYAWQCEKQCLPPLDTGVPASERLEEFEKELSTYEPHNLVIRSPLSAIRVVGAKVYAPHILMHFIECGWGGCYNSIYTNFLVPHFDSVPVLDYVLRSPVVGGETSFKDGIPEPRMFPELQYRLKGVRSAEVQDYLTQTFESRHTGAT